MNGMFNMDELHADCKYGIFDDFDWTKFTSYKQWLGAQAEFTITDKYRKKNVCFGVNPVFYYLILFLYLMMRHGLP